MNFEPRLLLENEDGLQIYYAPFDFINNKARVVLVGLTPGRTQMVNALREAHRQLNTGATQDDALRAAKKTGGFSGPMRPNLVALLDSIGLQRWLRVRSCEELFSGSTDLVQTASVLRYPVFQNDANYSGSPDPITHPLLRRYVMEYFAEDARDFSNAIFVPLGDKAGKVLKFLGAQGAMEKARIFDGLPHPSGANAERIAYFLGKKSRDRLSSKTDPTKLDSARQALLDKVATLPVAA